MIANAKIETLVTYALLISVVGIVLILILRELDVFTSDIFGTIASIPTKIGQGLVGGVSAVWNFVKGVFTTK